MSHASLVAIDAFKPFRQFVSRLLLQKVEIQLIGEASDGLEAVRKVQELQPDLILLEVALPSLNGIEVARRVREFAPATKLLFLSLVSSPEIVREALNVGALGYIHKLRAYEDLLPAIDAVLAGKRFISTGLDFIDGPRHHEILFCSDNEAILDSLARFIAAALNANNPAIVHVTEANRISLLQKLRMQVDIDSAIRNGTYVSSETSEKPDLVRMRQAINAVREAASKAGKKHARVAVCGERAGRLWANGQADEAIRLEQLCNQLAQDDDVDILCPYPTPYDREDDPALKRICAEHSAVSFR